MTLPLSTFAISEKNKLASTGAWIMLLEIISPISSTYIRVCTNDEDIEWNSETWYAFPFEIDDIGETSKGEVPQLTCRVSNITRVIQAQVETEKGGVGSLVTIMVVHSDNLDEATPEISIPFEVTGSSFDEEWAYFILGVPSPFKKRFPRNRVLNTFCNHKYFKGTRCQYTGGETKCDRTLARCRQLNNSVNFGGFPGVGARGINM